MPRSARSLTGFAKGAGIGSNRGLLFCSKHLRIASSIKAQRSASSFSPASLLANRHHYQHPSISQSRRSYHKNVLAHQSDTSSTSPDGASLSDDLLLESDDESDDDNDNDERTDQPWKTLLELPSRVAWRASDPHPPDPVVTAQSGVLNAGGATTKQLRRTYAGIIASHQALAERRERERRRLINRTHYSRRAQERDDDAQPVFYGKMETLAYLRNRMTPNYAIAKRVFEETKSLLGYSLYSGSHSKKSNHNGWRPKRIIDMGIGVGSASAAALEVFGDDVEWVHGVDPSRCMRECAKEFLEEIMEQKQQSSNDNKNGSSQQRVNPPRLTLTGSISADTESRKPNSATSTGFDMALMTYTATEFPGVASNLAAAAILWQKLSPNGVFIMIEPGTPDGFNSIRSVRTMLLDCCPPPGTMEDGDSDTESDSDDDTIDDSHQVAEECHIIAPCTHNGKCPMERHQHDFFKQKNPKTQRDMTNYSKVDFDFGDVDENVDNWDDEEWDTPSTSSRGPGLTEETDFLSRRFCSFVQTMSTGSHLRKGEKFSYLVAQKRVPAASAADDNSNAPVGSFKNDRLRDLLTSVYYANELSSETRNDEEAEEKQRRQVQDLFEEAQALEAKYLDSEEDELGMEFLQSDNNRESFARIIRAPLKKKGHVLIDYCAAPGRLMRTRVSKALDSTVAPGLYTAARKSRWGGLWPDVAAGDLHYFEASANEEPTKKS